MLCEKFARLCVSAALLVGSISFAAPANADIIYSDTFTGTNGTALNGHVPDVTTGGASWTAESGFTLQNGTAATSAEAGASLPIVITSGSIYTLSADIDIPTGSSGHWLGMGFAAANYSRDENGGLTGLAQVGCDWMLQTDAGLVYASPGIGTGGIYQCNSVTTGVSHHYSTVLNTSITHWSATWYVDGSQVYQSTYGSNWPTGQYYVMLTCNNTLTSAGSYDNLTLSSTSVPEPSALSLLVVGVISLLAYAWRKRR